VKITPREKSSFGVFYPYVSDTSPRICSTEIRGNVDIPGSILMNFIEELHEHTNYLFILNNRVVDYFMMAKCLHEGNRKSLTCAIFKHYTLAVALSKSEIKCILKKMGDHVQYHANGNRITAVLRNGYTMDVIPLLGVDRENISSYFSGANSR